MRFRQRASECMYISPATSIQSRPFRPMCRNTLHAYSSPGSRRSVKCRFWPEIYCQRSGCSYLYRKEIKNFFGSSPSQVGLLAKSAFDCLIPEERIRSTFLSPSLIMAAIASLRNRTPPFTNKNFPFTVKKRTSFLSPNRSYCLQMMHCTDNYPLPAPRQALWRFQSKSNLPISWIGHNVLFPFSR